MKKMIWICFFVLFLAGIAVLAGLVRDKSVLQNEIIRLHVVAESDSDLDQAVKLKVRDAVLEEISTGMKQSANCKEAEKYLKEHISELEDISNHTLEAAGVSQTARVSFKQENFPKREYDTFTLPSGVYDSLRIVIGNGKGHNWWCVVFPELCLPETVDGVESVSASSGFSRPLIDTLTNKDGYEIRFFFLDLIGKLENFFCRKG